MKQKKVKQIWLDLQKKAFFIIQVPTLSSDAKDLLLSLASMKSFAYGVMAWNIQHCPQINTQDYKNK